MTPDTTGYMIAGFAVILAGILIYRLTLSIRIRSVRKKLEKLGALLEESIELSEQIKSD
jgi:hypothetical protein